MPRTTLLAALALVLSGGHAFSLQALPRLPVMDADFAKALAQAPTSSPLGLTPKFRGRVADWPISSPRPVTLDILQETIVGTIDGGGNYDVTLPAQLPGGEKTTLEQLIRRFNVYRKDDCSVDTLTVSAPDAVAGELLLQASSTVPPSLFSGKSFELFTDYFNANELALYSSVAATAKGELSCFSKDWNSRYHLFVNIALAQGWNTATVLYGEENTIAGEKVQKMLLKGGLGRSGLD